MFKFRYSRSDMPNSDGIIQLREGEIFLQVTVNADRHLHQWEWPLKLHVWDNFGNLNWTSSDLYPNHWITYLDSYNKEMKLLTATGRQLFNWKFDPIRDGDICYQAFTWWAKMNPNTRGLVIGANDGACGEWVDPVLSGELRAHIIEPTTIPYEKLVRNWQTKPWVTFEKTLVTSDGSQVEFWEGQHSVCNSIIKSHSESYSGEVTPVLWDSVALSDLIQRQGLWGKWWLHIDVEGYDDQLIKALPVDNLPAIIVFEHVNFSEEVRADLLRYLESLGYFTQLCYMNGVSIKR